jgi:asparagine synthase (glutamine-hydrolysing)
MAPLKILNRQSVACHEAGYYTLRNKHSWAMMRCHTYKERPTHADMLHLDLWYKGKNILRDGGSGMYYCQEPWQNYFLSTAAHNCLEIDSKDQMIKGPRFLWLRWTRSRVIGFGTSSDENVGYFEGEHFGYTHLPGRVVQRRIICRICDSYVIIDDVNGCYPHDVAMRWRLFPADWQNIRNSWRADIAGRQISLSVLVPESMNCTLLKGQEYPAIEGWESLYYCQKTPAPTLVIKGNISLPIRMVTIVSVDEQDIEIDDFDFKDTGAAVILKAIKGSRIANSISDLSKGKIRCQN